MFLCKGVSCKGVLEPMHLVKFQLRIFTSFLSSFGWSSATFSLHAKHFVLTLFLTNNWVICSSSLLGHPSSSFWLVGAPWLGNHFGRVAFPLRPVLQSIQVLFHSSHSDRYVMPFLRLAGKTHWICQLRSSTTCSMGVSLSFFHSLFGPYGWCFCSAIVLTTTKHRWLKTIRRLFAKITVGRRNSLGGPYCKPRCCYNVLVDGLAKQKNLQVLTFKFKMRNKRTMNQWGHVTTTRCKSFFINGPNDKKIHIQPSTPKQF